MINRLVNLTPHEVKIYTPERIHNFAPNKHYQVARVEMQTEQVGEVLGIPLYQTVFGEVINLPAPEENTMFIVSGLVLRAAKHRDDLVAPDTGTNVVRDSEGRIAAVRGFVIN
jgi:hypothetical protein